jgi:hypothetical protein
MVAKTAARTERGRYFMGRQRRRVCYRLVKVNTKRRVQNEIADEDGIGTARRAQPALPAS